MSWTRRSLLGAAALAGCRPILGWSPHPGASAGEGAHIAFLSVGCFYVRVGDRALLTDPFLSHLPFGKVVFGETVPDERYQTPVREDLSLVRAVTVGHGHYDHCLDVPAVDGRLHRDARIFASRTVQATFAASGLRTPIVAVNDHQASADEAGAWLACGGSMRVLAIRGGHPDQIPGIHLYPGQRFEPRAEPPTKASHYPEGATYAYLVDFLDGDDVAFRVFVETSSRGWPDGFFPLDVLRRKRVDLALVSMDHARRAANGLFDVTDVLDPRLVLAGHWSDFFRRKDQSPWQTVKVDLPRVQRGLDRRRRPWRIPSFDSRHFLELERG